MEGPFVCLIDFLAILQANSKHILNNSSKQFQEDQEGHGIVRLAVYCHKNNLYKQHLAALFPYTFHAIDQCSEFG